MATLLRWVDQISKVWFFEDKNTHVAVRNSQSVAKKMLCAFFNTNIILQHVVFDSQKTVTVKWCSEQCMPKFVEFISKFKNTFLVLSTWKCISSLYKSLHRLFYHYKTETTWALSLHSISSSLRFCTVKIKMNGREFCSNDNLLRRSGNKSITIPKEIWQMWSKDLYWKPKRWVVSMKIILKKFNN